MHFEQQKTLRTELRSLLEPVAAEMQLRLSGVEFTQNNRGLLIRLYLDGDTLSIDKCTKFSKEISPILDAEDPIPSSFTLEVSSPGFDRLLELREDFIRFEKFHIRVKVPTKKNKLNGVLLSSDENGFTMSTSANDRTIAYADALSVRLNPTPEEITRLATIKLNLTGEDP